MANVEKDKLNIPDSLTRAPRVVQDGDIVAGVERIRLDNCGTADGEWVRAEFHDAEVSKLQGEVARLKAIVALGKTCDYQTCEEITYRNRTIEQLAADLVREGQMRAALHSQLRLAEGRSRPARHRPGGDVQVGWDPEGE